ncbi:MAG TPA: type II toxin-antitoxin system Phd/YefM family antitoxin [Frankiaceae bacterium]|nr:type II toxin-antitoxin system Phd/YefM family antitoxin [Frankiaceae bacterium]
MNTLPLADVKARLSEIADEVDRTHERVLITKNGREYVVLMSVEDLESIEATLELLADPAAQRRLRKAERDVAAGRGVDADALREAMERGRGRRHP